MRDSDGRSSTPPLTTPDTRLTSANRTRGHSNLNFGSASDNTRPRSPGQPPPATSLRSVRPGSEGGRDVRSAFTGPRAPSSPGSRDHNAVSGRGPGGSSRYPDGRSSVYRAPDRYTAMRNHSAYSPRHDAHDSHNGHYDSHGGHHDSHGGHHNAPYYYASCAPYYYHHAFSPTWCGPVAYPAGNYFGFGWNNGSWGLSFGYSSTRYYDSWSSGGWGCSGVYYGGWANDWYGGFSYVYNPWPVYRTSYLYDPVPVVTSVETGYVTQPATTTYVVQEPAAPQAQVQQAAPVAYAPAPPQSPWEAAPAVARAETAAASCFCPCHCNGQRPCTCDYPCGAEYALAPEQFDLSLAYRSYAEALTPETIWSSYAGLDRWDNYSEPPLYDSASASAGSDGR